MSINQSTREALLSVAKESSGKFFQVATIAAEMEVEHAGDLMLFAIRLHDLTRSSSVFGPVFVQRTNAAFDALTENAIDALMVAQNNVYTVLRTLHESRVLVHVSVLVGLTDAANLTEYDSIIEDAERDAAAFYDVSMELNHICDTL